MPRLQWWTVSIFVLWTIALGAFRVETALSNPDLRGVEQALRLGATGLFLVLAVALAVVHWQSRFYPAGIARAGLVRVLAICTIGYWTVRSLGFFYRDFNFAFTGTHLVLALVSGGLALTAVVMSLPTLPAGQRSSSRPRRSLELVDGPR